MKQRPRIYYFDTQKALMWSTKGSWLVARLIVKLMA
jgi:hypothetical protein